VNQDIKVTVDRENFLELARVFQRNRRGFRAANVIFALGKGQLRIAFHDGGCVLACECPQPLVAELTAKAFAGIAIEHRHDKSSEKTIQLTFRPEFGEFATPLAGAKAKIKLLE
jgi:hypothetical protein